MHLSPENIDRARLETAPGGLAARISKTRDRRRSVRRLAITSACVVALSIPMLMAPRPAYAVDPLAAIAGSLEQPIMQVKTWRDIRGQLTSPQEQLYRGNTSVTRMNAYTELDNGKVRQQYFADADKLFTDKSFRKSEAMPRPALLEDFRDKRWKWKQAAGKQNHKGTDAHLFVADGTYRDGGRDHSIRVKVYTDTKSKRVMFVERRVDDNWSDFFEYSYPASANFALGDTAATTRIDTEADRKRLREFAATAKPGLVAVVVDMWGSVNLITRGGAVPDPKRPQTITFDGLKFQGSTYAQYGVGKPSLDRLGKDFYVQAGNVTLSSRDDLKKWQERDFSKPVEIKFTFEGKSVTEKVKVYQSSVGIHFIGPFQATGSKRT